MNEIHHETVYFTGRVQGVGFRYAVQQVAKEFEVTGFVQNLADGRVLVEVESTQAETDAFVGAIAERMHGYVRHVERSNQRRRPQFSYFSIR